MSDPAPADALLRENAYLRQRNAQLQTDVSELTSELDRLRQMMDRLYGRQATRRPDPLSGGQ